MVNSFLSFLSSFFSFFFLYLFSFLTFLVVLNFTLSPFLPLQIEWIKECGIVLETLQMGSEMGYSNIIWNGRAQPGWRQVSFGGFLFLHTYRFINNNIIFNL